MSKTITPITLDDLNNLYQIEVQAHLVPWSKGTLANNLGNNYINLKLEVENELVGFVICQTVLDEATLFNIAISPQHQGKGFGKDLLKALCQQLQDKNIMTLWLEVRESNQVAKHLYENFGFNEVSIRKNYYPMTNSQQRENAIVMAMII